MKIQFKIGFLFLVIMLVTGCGSSSSNGVSIVTPGGLQIFYAHNLVFKNSSTLLSSGYNGHGQLGNNSTTGRNLFGGLDKYYPFRGYAAGGNHSIAFTNNSSVVYSWGYNGFGVLGNGTIVNSSVPVRSGTLSGVKYVAAGAYHSVAASDNTVWAWGLNNYGQLGSSSVATPLGYSSTPLRVTGSTPTPFSNISSVSANGYFTLVRASGRVYAWGENLSGQLGLPTTTLYSADPLTVNGISASIRDISAGSAFGLAVDSNGSLWSWGDNGLGQLGIGTKISSHIPSKVQTKSGDLVNVSKCAGGFAHGLALLTDGTVWAWGYNAYGQIGNYIDPATGKLGNSSVAIEVKGATGASLNATDIRAFGSSSMAKIGGVWYAWGDNTYGQLGIGSSVTTAIPTRLAGF